MSSSGIHHIAILVADLEEMHEFYLHLPGMKWLQFQFDSKGKKRSSWFQIGNTILMLELPSGEFSLPPPHDSKYTAKIRILFSAFDSNGNLLALEKLHENITNRTDYTIYMVDPEGNSLGYSSYPQKLQYPNIL